MTMMMKQKKSRKRSLFLAFSVLIFRRNLRLRKKTIRNVRTTYFDRNCRIENLQIEFMVNSMCHECLHVSSLTEGRFCSVSCCSITRNIWLNDFFNLFIVGSTKWSWWNPSETSSRQWIWRWKWGLLHIRLYKKNNDHNVPSTTAR